MIPTSLSHLLEGLIDYAGLFPPAALPMNEAFENYRRYLSEPDAWMLSQFIIPAARLPELPRIDSSEGRPVLFSIILKSGADAASYLESLEKGLDQTLHFLDTKNRTARVSAFEVKLPSELELAAKLAKETRAQIDVNGLEEASIFFEAPADEALPSVIEALREATLPRIGFKLRCGGLRADQFPSTRQVASVLHHCAIQDLPLKFTAGLHHPIRHYNESVQTKMHGFLNVFAAALIAKQSGLDPDAIEELVACENPREIFFADDALTFCGRRISSEDIKTLRQQFALSYGSCSFDEGREDLQALGLLPQPT